MRKFVIPVLVAAMAVLVAMPAWADDVTADEMQALREEMKQLRELVGGQQERIKQQDWKLQQQERKILDLEEYAEEPTPYANTESAVAESNVNGFTLGGGAISVTPYGFLRLDMVADDSKTFHGYGNTHLFVFPENGDDDDGSYNMTATATRFGFNFDGPEFEGGKVRGKLEFDFDGPGGTLTQSQIRMRHAYAELVYPNWSILAGQTWDVIGPRIPYMLDCMVMWASGNVGYRHPQLRLTKWGNLENGAKVTGQIALSSVDRNLTGTDDFDGDGLADGEDAGWPMVQARLGLDTVVGDGNKVSLGVFGAIGEEEADYDGGGADEDADVWIVGIDGSVTVIPGKLLLNGEIWTGENLSTFMGGLFTPSVVVVNSDPEETEVSGGFLHAMITPCKKMKINLGGGIDDVDNDDLATGTIDKNWTLFGNVIYTLTPHVDIGAELAWHETEYKNADDGDNLRLQMAFIYKF